MSEADAATSVRSSTAPQRRATRMLAAARGAIAWRRERRQARRRPRPPPSRSRRRARRESTPTSDVALAAAEAATPASRRTSEHGHRRAQRAPQGVPHRAAAARGAPARRRQPGGDALRPLKAIVFAEQRKVLDWVGHHPGSRSTSPSAAAAYDDAVAQFWGKARVRRARQVRARPRRVVDVLAAARATTTRARMSRCPGKFLELAFVDAPPPGGGEGASRRRAARRRGWMITGAHRPSAAPRRACWPRPRASPRTSSRAGGSGAWDARRARAAAARSRLQARPPRPARARAPREAVRSPGVELQREAAAGRAQVPRGRLPRAAALARRMRARAAISILVCAGSPSDAVRARARARAPSLSSGSHAARPLRWSRTSSC